ncbi:MAG: acetate/propionate family kinase [Aquificota bacterium]|nr:acetate/propionate family kinase [Aquificota bacterium]
MRLLVLNCGSTNLKWALWDGSRFLKRERVYFRDERDLRTKLGYIKESAGPLKGVIHRVVHGKDLFEPTLIDRSVKEKIKEAVCFSPLHNRLALAGIEVFEDLEIPQVAVFDTYFFRDLPKASVLYPLPYELFEAGVRRYGFHGISYSFVLDRLKELLGDPYPTAILLHIGGGASVCAVKNGKPVDTSMGLTPLEGLMMSTRCGDIDPGVILYLLKKGVSPEELEDLLWRRSGFAGLCGSGDIKEVLGRDDPKAREALEVFVRRVKKYIGGYIALIGRPQAVVFTGGAGEGSPPLRNMILRGLSHLGIEIDEERNSRNDTLISGGEVKVFVIKTDEELQMVRLSLGFFT